MLIIIELIATMSLKAHFIIDILNIICVFIAPISVAFEMLKKKKTHLGLKDLCWFRVLVQQIK